MRAAFRRMVLRRIAPGELVVAWPGVSTALTRELKAMGCTVVVEFINTHCGWAREVLEAEHARLGLEWGVLDDGIVTYDDERAAEADVIFAPNHFVEESIRGRVPGHGRLLPTSYGAPLVPGQRPRRPGGGRFTFLFVGQFGVRKGAHTLIEACRSLGDRIVVEVAGRVTPDIEAYAARHGMPSNIRQLGFQRDMGDAYGRADALVFPSLEAGGPRVCYEAAAYGLPMVVTEVGGGRIADDGGTGYVVPPSDPEALADAMMRLAADPDRYEAFSARALEAVKPFAWEKVTEDRHRQLLELGY
jgi:glycosyltransferase involved in cell wall biosynthesis